jgi:hypothetical protein
MTAAAALNHGLLSLDRQFHRASEAKFKEKPDFNKWLNTADGA